MAAKKILVVKGSPRKKGNSAALADQITAGAESKGALVERYLLQKMKIAPCIACNNCRKENAAGCVVDDDMQALYPKIVAADTIVIASPIYWFSVSAQTKAFIDRWYALNKTPGKLAGKRICPVLAYADPDVFTSGGINALRMFQDICRYLGAQIGGMIYGCADAAGEIKKNDALMAAALKLGEDLALA